MIEPKELGRGELEAFDAAASDKLGISHEGYLKLRAHIAAQAEEEDHLQRLVIHQGKLLRGVVNAIRGEPGPLSMHSVHDAPDLARRAMEVLGLVTFAGRITGGTAGRDEQLCAALDAAEAFLPPVKSLTDVGVPLPGWEEVSRKAERGEPLNPIEALVMRLTPGDEERAKDFRRMLRAALDYTAQQPRVDER